MQTLLVILLFLVTAPLFVPTADAVLVSDSAPPQNGEDAGEEGETTSPRGGSVTFARPVTLRARGVATLKPQPTAVPADDFSRVGLGKSVQTRNPLPVDAETRLFLQDAAAALRLGISRPDLASRSSALNLPRARAKWVAEIRDALAAGESRADLADSIDEALRG